MITSVSPEISNLLLVGSRDQRMYINDKEFLYFCLYYFPEFFSYEIAKFQYCMFDDCKRMASTELDEVAWIMFRESGKTSLAKMFVIWCICYKKKRYINYDSYDKENAESALFDIAVTLQTNQKLIADFGQLFNRARGKGEEKESTVKRLSNFITENGVRVSAFSTQEPTRGRIYKHIRPDLFILDDIENSKTKDSYALTSKVKAHVDEMRAGMGASGTILVLGNYITEEGSIAYIMESLRQNTKAKIRSIPVVNREGRIMWRDKYVLTDAEAAEANGEITDASRKKISLESKRRSLGSEVYETEMMNNPAKSGDLIFDRRIIDELLTKARKPLEEIAGLKIWGEFKASHRYGGGADVSEGIGKDACASVIIDYSGRPKAQVIATFEDNQVDPVQFAHHLARQGKRYGECIFAPERNSMGYATVAELVQLYDNVYQEMTKIKTDEMPRRIYGWQTTSGNKSDIMLQLKKAVEDGELEVFDLGLLTEMKYFRKKDLRMVNDEEGATRHFDKLKACAIAWEMRVHAELPEKKNSGVNEGMKDSDFDPYARD